MGFDLSGLGAAFGFAQSVVDRVIPDPAAKLQAQQALLQLQQQGEFKQIDAAMSAITTEGGSSDPWTSRARPTFMYVFYGVIVALVIVAPAIGVFWPSQMKAFFDNVGAGFRAIPEAMWATFTAGYLGYAGARAVEKIKGVA